MDAVVGGYAFLLFLVGWGGGGGERLGSLRWFLWIRSMDAWFAIRIAYAGFGCAVGYADYFGADFRDYFGKFFIRAVGGGFGCAVDVISSVEICFAFWNCARFFIDKYIWRFYMFIKSCFEAEYGRAAER